MFSISRLTWCLAPENTLGRPVADIAGQAISAGFTCVQVRSKECSARELIACTAAVADEIARLGATDRVALLVDDRLDVVYAARQQGVKVDGARWPKPTFPWKRAAACLVTMPSWACRLVQTRCSNM